MGPPPSPGGRGVNPPVDHLIFILLFISLFLSLLSPFFSKIGAPFSYLTSDFGAAVERPQQQKGISNRAQNAAPGQSHAASLRDRIEPLARGHLVGAPVLLLSACNTTEGGREGRP